MVINEYDRSGAKVLRSSILLCIRPRASSRSERRDWRASPYGPVPELVRPSVT